MSAADKKMNYRDVVQPNYRHVGKYTPRIDAKDIVTGHATYLDDFNVPGQLYGKTLRSPYPHAKILSIDATKAEALPGVRAVVTYKNAPEQWGLGLPVHRHLLEDEVWCVGDVVALVAADTLEIAEEALDLIDVEYKKLPAVFNAEDALKGGAPQLYKRFPGNHVDNGIKYFQPDGPWWQIRRGDPEAAFAECAYVAEDRVEFDKMPSPAAPETPSAIAKWTGGTDYTLWASSQSSHILKLMAEGRIDHSNFDVRTFNVGGSYGNKQSLMTTVLSACMLSRVTSKPVKVVMTKEEQLTCYEVRLGSIMNAKIGITKDGIVNAIKGKWLVDTGSIADSIQGQVGVGLGEAQLVCAKCANWDMDSEIAVTNRQAAGIVRGYGGQELNSCLERLMATAMKEGNLNPLDVFKKNYVAPGDRFQWRDGRWWQSRSSMFFPEAMQGAADRFNWDKKWVGWNKPYWVSPDGKKARGVGMGVIGNADINEDNTECICRIIPDLVGKPRASKTVIEMDVTESGMGTRSNVVKQVAEILNVPVETVYITDPGSKYNPSNYGLCGSRGTITTGKAATLAAMECKQKALELAATHFHRSIDQMETKDYMVYVRDTPELMVPMFKLCDKELSICGYGKHLELFNIPSCIAVFVDVEVDLETGRQRLLHIGAGTDIGQILDPKAVEMQLHGGIGSACVDTASMEECLQDPITGRLVTASMLEYKMRTFNEFPTYDAYVMESQIDTYVFKALGIGEVSGAALGGAVLMAISNATGKDIKTYPATPGVILSAIGKA